jgi:hypothetical protein
MLSVENGAERRGKLSSSNTTLLFGACPWVAVGDGAPVCAIAVSPTEKITPLSKRKPRFMLHL